MLAKDKDIPYALGTKQWIRQKGRDIRVDGSSLDMKYGLVLRQKLNQETLRGKATCTSLVVSLV